MTNDLWMILIMGMALACGPVLLVWLEERTRARGASVPALVTIKGYQAWNWLGLGEDLPKGVYRDWKHWCRFPRYFFEDPKMAWLNDHFAAVRTPIVGAVSLDDLWAGPESRDAFMSAFTNAAYQPRDIDPKALGLKPLGHMGYFRPYAEPLWRDALDWFASQPQAAAAA